MAEGAPLLREYGLTAHRGFESHPLRFCAEYGLCTSKKMYSGGVAERLNALVLKTSVPQGTGGSNPSPSALCEDGC